MKIVETADAPSGNAGGRFSYSQAVVAGGLVFVSGQGPFDPASRRSSGRRSRSRPARRSRT